MHAPANFFAKHYMIHLIVNRKVVQMIMIISNSYCNYGFCSCKNGYTESISTCIRDHTVDLYNYSHWNIAWIPIIFCLIAIFILSIRLCIICFCFDSSKRTSQIHTINTPANNFNTISSGVPFVYNNPNPSSSILQLSCTQPPFDFPPKYDEVVSINQLRNN